MALVSTRLYPDDPEVLYHSGRLFANFAYLQTIRLERIAPDSVWLHQAAGEANESQGLSTPRYASTGRCSRSPRAAGPSLPHRPCPAHASVQAKGDAAAEASALSEFERGVGDQSEQRQCFV